MLPKRFLVNKTLNFNFHKLRLLLRLEFTFRFVILYCTSYSRKSAAVSESFANPLATSLG